MFLLHLLTIASTGPVAVSQNVVILIADGLRYEEVFGGADERLVSTDQLENCRPFLQGNEQQRREALMPFFWHSVVKNGQVFGDQSLGSISEVTNKRNCSYPGYSETMCGYVDPGIKSNIPMANANESVFEWLNREPEFSGRVAAFGAWEVISAVFNKQRCNFTDDAAYEPVTTGRMTPTLEELNQEEATLPHQWRDEAPDQLAFKTTLEYVKANHPRAIFLSLGETDHWAHHERYDRYLEAAHQYDADVAKLWHTMQGIPQYKNKTTFIVSCDHGRGIGKDWTSHGKKYEDSKYTWMGFMGPGTRPLGEVPNTHVTNGQIAATAAAVLGYNYAMSQPKAAPYISSVVR